MKSSQITIEMLKTKLNAKTDKELSLIIDIPVNTIRTWKSRGIPAKEQIKFLNTIFQNELPYQPNTSQQPLPPDILELIEDYQKLDDDKKEIYRLKIKKDAIEKQLKERGVDD